MNTKKYLLILSLILVACYNTYSDTVVSNCSKDKASILLSNTLDVVASIDILLVPESKTYKTIRISKEIAPGGMKTICISKETVYSRIVPCIKSKKLEYANVYYTFNKQHIQDEPLAFIMVTENFIYPAII